VRPINLENFQKIGVGRFGLGTSSVPKHGHSFVDVKHGHSFLDVLRRNELSQSEGKSVFQNIMKERRGPRVPPPIPEARRQ